MTRFQDHESELLEQQRLLEEIQKKQQDGVHPPVSAGYQDGKGRASRVSPNKSKETTESVAQPQLTPPSGRAVFQGWMPSTSGTEGENMHDPSFTGSSKRRQ